jgi:hypothetical protein
MYEDRLLGARLNQAICARRDEITSRSALAAALDEHREHMNAFREEQTTEALANLIARSDFEKMSEWADYVRSGMWMTKTDTALGLEVRQLDPKEILGEMCSRFDAQSE